MQTFQPRASGSGQPPFLPASPSSARSPIASTSASTPERSLGELSESSTSDAESLPDLWACQQWAAGDLVISAFHDCLDQEAGKYADDWRAAELFYTYKEVWFLFGVACTACAVPPLGSSTCSCVMRNSYVTVFLKLIYRQPSRHKLTCQGQLAGITLPGLCYVVSLCWTVTPGPCSCTAWTDMGRMHST